MTGIDTTQENWRFCGNCTGWFYVHNGFAHNAGCPAGGEHDLKGSFDYFPNADPTAIA
jgi:hypothetical protein